MAIRLIEAGHTVRVFDPNERAVAELEGKGASAHRSPSEAAKDASFLLSSLPTPATLRKAVTASGGILDTTKSGSIVIDFSTVDPATAKEVAAACEARGVGFIDAPVSGGVLGAASGKLLVMVGGDEQTLARAKPVFDVLAGRVVHCGPVGSGQLTKLSHNLLTAINTVALGEVLAASVKSGADLQILTEVLGGGMAGSKMLDYLPKTLFTAERPANFAVDLMHKDITLALDEFGGHPMFLGQVVRQIYNTARAEGLGGKDSTSVAEVYERLLNIRLHLPSQA
jgi:3-hydroxyisobutyrate dehydrogenase-like beta-hydroxyacid dehydrogenase